MATSVTPITTLKTYFQTGDKPTETQFADLIDSFANFSPDFSNKTFASTITGTHTDNSVQFDMRIEHNGATTNTRSLILILKPILEYTTPYKQTLYGDAIFVNLYNISTHKVDKYQRILIKENYINHAFLSNRITYTAMYAIVTSYLYHCTGDVIPTSGLRLTWQYAGVLYGTNRL